MKDIQKHPHIELSIDGDIPKFSWFAHRHLEFERGPRWWAIFFGIFIGLAIATAFFALYLQSLLIVMLAGVYYMIHRTPSQEVPVTLSEMGVYFDNKFHSYNDIETFVLSHPVPGVDFLHIELKKEDKFLHGKELDILLTGQNVLSIRDFLLHQIPEKYDKTHSLSQWLIWMLRM
ncbi:MAG: hypothetical protein U9Q15_04185 [Patescibacteria group bacterium]|nr:hypothetical protein [Patescibacteria group bacterium]